MNFYDIAFLLGSPDISGGTNVIMEHALGLTRIGHRVSIITERPFDRGRLAWKPEAMSLPLYCHADVRTKVFDLAISTWWRTCFDLPFVHARRYAYFVQSIESRFFAPQDQDYKALAEFTYRLPMPIVTEATWIAKHLNGTYGRTASLVLNGIDKQSFRTDGPPIESRSSGSMRVLVEGPLGVEFKRTELALDLCRQAGVKDLWLLTSSECDSMPGCTRVLSRIPITRVGEVYRSCDVLVKLSTVEGMFGPPLEMFHCGGTAITSDVTGHDEYMKHGVNGLIVRRGNESEVVDHLRSLEREPDLLASLKSGASATAAAWPDWKRSSDEFERVIRGFIERDFGEKTGNEHMNAALRGALRLAGPLRDAIRRDFSGHEALHRVKRRIKERIARRLPLLSDILDVPPQDPVLPQYRWRGATLPLRSTSSKPLTCKDAYRIAYITPPNGMTWHIPMRGNSRISTLRIAIEKTLRESDLAQLEAFQPDVVFHFAVERCTRKLIARIPGFVVGHTDVVATAPILRALREAFPIDDTRVGLAHHDARQIPAFLAGGIRVLGPLQRGVDIEALASTDDFDRWSARPVNLVFVGKSDSRTRDCIAELRSIPGFMHIGSDTDDITLINLLRQTRYTIHLPSEDGFCQDGSLALRDIACGCHVIAPRFSVDCGLLAGEHYTYIHNSVRLLSVVRTTLEQPDPMDVIRKVGMRRALECDAGNQILRFVEHHLCERAVGPTA